MPVFERQTLPNGLRLLTAPIEHAQSVSCFLMLAAGVLEHEPDISDDELREVLSSNLCRCTGYSAIYRSVSRASRGR